MIRMHCNKSELPPIRSTFELAAHEATPTGLWMPRTVWAHENRKLATLESFAPSSTCVLPNALSKYNHNNIQNSRPSNHKDCDVLQGGLKKVFSPPVFDDGEKTNNTNIKIEEISSGSCMKSNVNNISISSGSGVIHQPQQLPLSLKETSIPYIKKEEGVYDHPTTTNTTNTTEGVHSQRHQLYNTYMELPNQYVNPSNQVPPTMAPVPDTERRPPLPREILETLQSLAGVRLSELRMTGFHFPQINPAVMAPQIPSTAPINVAPVIAPLPQWPINNNWNCQPSWRGCSTSNPADFWQRGRREIPEETGQQPKPLTLDELKFRGLLRHIPMGGGENGDAMSQNRRDSKRNSFLKKHITPLVCALIEEGYDIRLGEKGRTRLKKEISLRFRVHANLRESCHKHVCRLKNANVIQLLAMSEITGCLPRCLEIANDYWRAYGARRVDPFVDSAGSVLKQNPRRGRKAGDDSVLKRKRGRPRHFSQPDSNNNRQAKRARTESDEETAIRNDTSKVLPPPKCNTVGPMGLNAHLNIGNYTNITEIKTEDGVNCNGLTEPTLSMGSVVTEPSSAIPIKIEEDLHSELAPTHDAPSDGLQSLEGLLELNSSRIKGGIH